MAAKRSSVNGRRVTMQMIADRAGVSVMTVSNVLRNQSAMFSPETAERVRRGIEELGFIPSRAPRAMRTGRFGSIAFVGEVSGTPSWVPRSLLDGVLDGATAYDLDLIYTRISLPEDGATPKLLREANVDGLLLNNLDELPDAMREEIARRYPVVQVNQRLAWDCVQPDEVAAGRLAARHLLAQGCVRPAFVSFWTEGVHFSFQDRLSGFTAAVTAAGLGVLGLDPGRRLPDRVAEVRAFVRDGRPDGICCATAFEAGAVDKVLAESGLQVRLVSFADAAMKIGLDVIPAVGIPLAEVGRQAVAMLMAKLASGGAPQPSVLVAPSPDLLS